MSYLDQNYISRPVLFLLYDARLRAYGQPVQAFLQEYFHQRVNTSRPLQTYGIIRHALNFEVTTPFSALRLSYDCNNGKVPDLDFVRIFQDYLVHSGLKVFLNRPPTASLRPLLHHLPVSSHHLFSQLMSSLTPNRLDMHPHFYYLGINSLTIKSVPSPSSRGESPFLLMGIMRDSLRSLSALDENLHAAATFHWACNPSGAFVTISHHFYPIITSLTSLLLYSFVLYKQTREYEPLGISLFYCLSSYVVGLVMYSNVYLL